MSEKDLPRRGYRRCEVCGEELPEGFCAKHELERPVILSRRQAKILSDIALALGHRQARNLGEEAEPIKGLIADLETGNYAIARQLANPATEDLLRRARQLADPATEDLIRRANMLPNDLRGQIIEILQLVVEMAERKATEGKP